MTNVLEAALSGKMNTIVVNRNHAITDNPVSNKEEVSKKVSKFNLSQKQKMLLSFTGLAVVGVASVMLNKRAVLKQNAELASQLFDKSKGIVKETQTVKETVVSLYDDAAETVKRALGKLDDYISAGHFQPVDGQNMYKMEFLDDTLCISDTLLQKNDKGYNIIKLVKKFRDGTKNAIFCNQDNTVKNIYKNFTEVGDDIASDVYFYESGKVKSVLLGANIGNGGKAVAEKGFIFGSNFMLFMEDCIFSHKNNINGAKKEFMFRGDSLKQVSLKQLISERLTLDKVLVFEKDKLKDVLPTTEDIPEYIFDISQDIVRAIFD